MPSKQPPLGSLAVQAPQLMPRLVHVSPATCHELSLFKELLKEYRKLDDSINMRLNRTTAQFLDREREGGSGRGNVEDQACAYMWKELVENWKRRTEIVEYCVGVVDASVEEKRKTALDQEADPAAQRRAKAEMYAEGVKRNQVRNELTVEQIVRQRSLAVFRSRCKFFQPPLSDAEARKWWDSAR